MAVGCDMDTGEQLYKAILENPDDDTPRLIYADWLDENEATVACKDCGGRGEVWDGYDRTVSCGRCGGGRKQKGDGYHSNGYAFRARFIRNSIELWRRFGNVLPVLHCPTHECCNCGALWVQRADKTVSLCSPVMCSKCDTGSFEDCTKALPDDVREMFESDYKSKSSAFANEWRDFKSCGFLRGSWLATFERGFIGRVTFENLSDVLVLAAGEAVLATESAKKIVEHWPVTEIRVRDRSPSFVDRGFRSGGWAWYLEGGFGVGGFGNDLNREDRDTDVLELVLFRELAGGVFTIRGMSGLSYPRVVYESGRDARVDLSRVLARLVRGSLKGLYEAKQ